MFEEYLHLRAHIHVNRRTAQVPHLHYPDHLRYPQMNSIHLHGGTVSNNNKRSKSKKPASASAGRPLHPPRDMPSGPSGDGEITIFLSYSRADDNAYQMVRPFKNLLSHFIYAKSGRKVSTFLDQEDIEWGDIWEDKLETKILGASVFIPLLSASYLDSENCRMEFNQFQTNASALGVKELLLPVLLINAPAIFNKHSSDDIVREAAARQWEVIEEAVLADAGTAAWKRTMARLADRFVKSYAAAESKLAALDESDIAASGTKGGAGEEDSGDDDDDPGLAELMESIQLNISQLTLDAESITPAIESLGTAARSANQAPNATPQQLQAWGRHTAAAFEDPAQQLSESGENMFNTTKALDVDMRRLRRIAVDLLPDNTGIAVGYNEMTRQLAGIGSVRVQLEDLLTKMKPAEVISVPLRRALRPARRGITRVNDSLKLIESWRSIDVES